MTGKSKVAGVAAAVKRAKTGTKSKSKSKPRKTPTPRKKKGAEQKTPTSGQSAPPIELSSDALNAKEAKVLAALNGSGSGVRPVMTITDLAAECFKSQSKKRANSWVRNSLRRLVQSGLIEKVERGKYRVSEAGRKGLARAA